MVIGETNGSNAGPDPQQTPAEPVQSYGLQQATIDNIMSGIENTGAVKMNNHRKKLRQRFDIIKKLGQGTYGKVQLGINKETGQEVAIKTIKKSKIETEADLIRIRREVQIMSSVQHPNIIHIYEVFENREKMVLVMEFAAGGELYDYLSDRKVLTEEEARRIFRQVSTAIYYCHKHKICHRDLKLENILLDEQGNAKIADFGLSNVFDEQRLLATFCGSPLYASPEIVKGTPYQGPEVDCWSLGVLLYTLVYGAMPFDGANFKRLVKQISQGDYFEPKKPSRGSPLIREMLTVCPVRRANIEQICNHWWVNEGYQESCLELAEELANQTPVRLDVLLSLAPPSVTPDQLVVPGNADDAKAKERVHRSHSVGSVIDLGTEAERRIMDMVAAGGEAALMPSPTRTMTPGHETSAQPKRKLENTMSMENATGGAKKREKAIADLKSDPSRKSIPEAMETQSDNTPSPQESIEKEPKIEKKEPANDQKKPEEVKDVLTTPAEDQKMKNNEKKSEVQIKSVDAIKKVTAVKKEVKPKPAEVVTAAPPVIMPTQDLVEVKPAERKTSLPDDTSKPTERRRSRILETAEKFQNMNNQNNDKFRKFTIPGVSVGNFKKEFERKASLTQSERKPLEKRDSMEQPSTRKNSSSSEPESITAQLPEKATSQQSVSSQVDEELNQSDSKSSIQSFSLEDARRSMENSIALLNKAKHDSSKEVDLLCAQTENIAVFEESDRQRKLRAAQIIGNAIPHGRLGVRKPPMPFGINGRSISGSVVQQPTMKSIPLKGQFSADSIEPRSKMAGRYASPDHTRVFDRETIVPEKVLAKDISPPQETKTSRADITLKSATLPRRKPQNKSDAILDIPIAIEPSNIRFSTEIKHKVPDLRSAPIREQPTTYASFTLQNRAASLEPQAKDNVPKPSIFARGGSNTYRNSLSRQSTNDSNDSDTTPTQSFAQSTSSTAASGEKQPIKKSPREFIIPISVEGGGVVTPKTRVVDPPDFSLPSQGSGSFSSSTKRTSRPRRISSIFNEKDSEEETSFPKFNRHTSLGRESDSEEPRFHSMHRLRSSRPTKRSGTSNPQDPNDSASSGEEDDDDGFELLTAENLFSTLLSRVRALTHRLNVNNDISTNFPSTRLMSNLRQSQSPFWNNDPFGSPHYSFRSETVTETVENSRSNMSPWRHSRDLQSDFDSMFSRSGATLPRGDYGSFFK